MTEYVRVFDRARVERMPCPRCGGGWKVIKEDIADDGTPGYFLRCDECDRSFGMNAAFGLLVDYEVSSLVETKNKLEKQLIEIKGQRTGGRGRPLKTVTSGEIKLKAQIMEIEEKLQEIREQTKRRRK